jgi:hypothetical protein
MSTDPRRQKPALNHTHAVARLAPPAESEYCSEKVWLAPDPELGVTELAVTASEAAGTVQVPSVCQPLAAPETSLAHKYTFFAPLNTGLNVIARFNVSRFALIDAVEAAVLIEHWLFCTLPLCPKAAPLHADPASLSRYTVLDGGL